MSHRPYILAILLLLSLLPAVAQWGQSERILQYHSDITVQRNATLTVRETIRVQVENININHGIYRDFPTRYRNGQGGSVTIGFRVQSATLDGRSEPYFVQNNSNGKRVYIGDKSRTVSRGAHAYTLTYVTDQQIGFFADHDELYWNVTGNGWVFPIDQASATVTLPSGISREQIHVEGYTGPQESKGQDYRASVDASGLAQFYTTRPLGPGEGLTIVVTFPKGVVAATPLPTRNWNRTGGTFNLWPGIIGLLLVTAYFLLAWWLYGKDIPQGTIIPRYTPPAGYSPAALRFVRRMGFDHKTFATALIDLAVKGYVTIDERNEGLFGGGRVYTVTREGDPDIPDPEQHVREEVLRGSAQISRVARNAGVPENTVRTIIDAMIAEGKTIDVNGDMVTTYSQAQTAPETPSSRMSPEEATLLAQLIPGGRGDSITLRNTQYRQIQSAIAAVKAELTSRYQNRLFVTNTPYYIPGVLLSALFLALFLYYTFRNYSGGDGREIGGLMFIGIPLVIFTAGAVPLWRTVFKRGKGSCFALVGALFFTGFLSIFVFAGLMLLNGTAALPLLFVVAAFIAVNVLFYYLMKAPTTAGRRLMDEIEGFRMYLDTAEKDRLNLENPPEKTPQLFEQYLPYALALDVEQSWSEQFAGVLAQASVGGQSYQPSWYSGNSWQTLGAAGFASSLGDSFSNAISSSSTAPGSSSGSGGGGSSGGGGGGGGGGGW